MVTTDRLYRALLIIALVPVFAVVHAQTPTTPVSAAAPATGEGWLLPGTFTQGTSLAALEARFGADNVRRVTPDADAHACEAILFPDDPERRAHAFFYDCEKLDQLRSIEIRDRQSRWRGKGGVHVGMSFDELRARNGKPFGFSGFDQDGRGAVHDQWSPATEDDATLGKLDVEEGDRMYFDVTLGVRADVSASARRIVPRDEYIASGDSRIPQLAPLLEVTGFGASTSLDDEWD
ncbi:hypothetical protein [Thermomonas carbonis]|uniref:Uncharacterized protein n=1 Tax=Thermomonas carbonis TaxID=1463158 RepID=A0A7G9SM90_9GAMM|nr:hypothetical protein [Thermomonas carbonis]QNN68965.1 hypothetical protein H9L16_09520 [Thermomonas carbonis]GHC07623.1 hypothetical protein GCM10010080_22770 [Thermomonas carbonis]